MIRLLKPLSFVPALLLMYMIYSFSAQDGDSSSQLSYKISYTIVETGGEILGADFEDWEVDQLATRFNIPLRKIAHMTEYFALAIAVAFPLYVYGLRGILLLLVAGILCVGFACGDEYHQSWVAGRGPSKRDVLIDSFGVFWGIILVRIIGWTGRRTFFRSSGAKNASQPDYPDGTASYGPQGPYYGTDGRMPDARASHARRGTDPYAQQNAGPYARQGTDPYAQQNAGPYARRGADPYAGQGAGPYAGQGANSYARQSADPYARQSAGYYGPQQDAYPGYPPYEPSDEDWEEDDDYVSSDRLSEDMSLRKLVSDLRDQKQTRRDSRKADGSGARSDK